MKSLLAVCVAFAAASCTRADFVVSPSPPSSIISYPLADPFFTTTNCGPSVRFQQVYGGADFLRYGDTSYLITEMTFTAGNGGGDPEVTLANLQINFSTTSKSGDRLSGTFGENVGSDATMVFSGSLHVVYTSFEGNMHIVLNQPFLFDPRVGNLLMDVRNFETIHPFPLQPGFRWIMRGFGNADDRSSIVVAYDVVSTNATFISTAAISTAFTVTPIPRLSVSLLSSNLLFCWINKPGGMLLEQSPAIGPGSSWTPAGGIVTTNGNYKEVLLPLETNATARFFRLGLPPSGSPAEAPDAKSELMISTPKR
jgi:hypothetical protein